MQREILLTADGSHTVSVPEMNVTYHSTHGSLQESMHVFIEAGLQPFLENKTIKEVGILEIGFGTGLNALLSWKTAREYQKKVRYTGIEPHPLSISEAGNINFGQLLSMKPEFDQLHQNEWGTENIPETLFSFRKINIGIGDLSLESLTHCIYFDAFAPSVQPELWTQEVFEKLISLLYPGGALLTYCSKSVVRHAMTAAGFRVEKIPGPRGKREMVRAWK